MTLQTMVLRVKGDESERWDSIKRAFWSAFDRLSSMRANEVNGEDVSYDALQGARQALWVVSGGVATFVSRDQAVLKEKSRIATAMMHLSATLDGYPAEDWAKLIAASAGELPEGRAYQEEDCFLHLAKAPTWFAAKAFWQAVSNCGRLGEVARAMLYGEPATPGELADKILIAAYLGTLNVFAGMIGEGSLHGDDQNVLRIWTERLMSVSPQQCLEAICDRRTFSKIVHDIQTAGAAFDLADTDLVRLMLGAADKEWRHAIWREAAILGVVPKTPL